MAIRKKSKEILKQQKESFFNYIKTKEKYSEAIADLFFDDEIENIDNIERVKHHLEEKWISKELVDELEMDYNSYLRTWHYYWFTDEYPEELKESIKENDKRLGKIKKDILKDYKQEWDLLSLDVHNFVEEWFSFSKNANLSIWGEIDRLEKETYKISENINELNAQLYNTSFFKFSAKKNLKREIKSEGDRYEEIESEIQKKKWWSKKINDLTADIKWFIWWEDSWNTMELCKTHMLRIKEEIEEFVDYIPNETILRMKEYIEELIYKWRIQKKEKLVEKINSYLNYSLFWEDKNVKLVGINLSYYRDRNGLHYHENFWFYADWRMPTFYFKGRIDTTITQIINKLWWNVERIVNTIDYNFLDDIFIHTTWFNVLDEILDEWWLISTNELWRRKMYNRDIQESVTQNTRPHKDVYFSRGFRKNWYWHHERTNRGFVGDDFVFIANSMTNFACSGYWVPLNGSMQWNRWFGQWDTEHDWNWYSIISRSALDKTPYSDSYTKIDLKDVYIFVPETKRQIIESNPEKYKTIGANIVYFPKEYSWLMSYKLYQFIKKEIESRKKTVRTPIPKEIITDDDCIKSINNWYTWAFCESVGDNPETKFNPLKDWDYDKIMKFFKENHGAKYLKDYGNFEVDFNRLRSFLNEKKEEIDQISVSFKFPNELIVLMVSCIKVFGWSRDDKKQVGVNTLSNELAKFGYSARELWIFYKVIGIMCYIVKHWGYNRDLIKENCLEIMNKMCTDWNIDHSEMKAFLIGISKVATNMYVGGSNLNLVEYILN